MSYFSSILYEMAYNRNNFCFLFTNCCRLRGGWRSNPLFLFSFLFLIPKKLVSFIVEHKWMWKKLSKGIPHVWPSPTLESTMAQHLRAMRVRNPLLGRENFLHVKRAFGDASMFSCHAFLYHILWNGTKVPYHPVIHQNVIYISRYNRMRLNQICQDRPRCAICTSTFFPCWQMIWQ